MEEVGKLIRDLGLPIVFCLWFMFRLEKKLEDATVALRNVLSALGKKEEGEEEK